MKKRLLSAALALAMVLTMLPLSVFAADATTHTKVTSATGDGTESVSYVQYNNTNNDYPDAPAWYVTHVTPRSESDAGGTDYIKVEEGVIVSGKYYSLTNAADTASAPSAGSSNTTIYNWGKDSNGTAYKSGLKSSVTVIGGTITIDAVNASNLSVDVCDGTVTIKQTNTNNSSTKLTSLTITNSKFANINKKGTIKLDSSLASLTSLSLTNAKISEKITLNAKTVSTTTTNGGGLAHSITLNGAETGEIELDGVGTNNPVTRAAQTVNITNSTVGAITVKGINSTVNLTEVKGNTDAPAVTIVGTGGNLNVKGGSKLGKVTLNGDTSSDKAQTTAPSSVSVETGSTVDSISSAQEKTEQALGKQTISISGTVTNAVEAKNAALTVSGGQTGALTVGTGTVTVSGNRANVGDVTLTKDATFTLSGTNCTVGDLTVDATNGTPATVTFNVPNDPSNTLGSKDGVSSSYTKQTIKGGTWKAAVPAANLDSSLMYQLEKAVGSDKVYTYYTSDQLGEAIIKQGSTTGSKLTKIGDSAASTTVTFMNGSMTWGTLSISPDISIPKLPTQMNNVNTPYWSDGKFTNLAGNYSVPSGGATLNAGGGGSVVTEVTELTDVKVGSDTSNITAALSGNVITLTGAVKTGDTKFTLTLETDAVTVKDGKEVPVTIEVSLIFDPSTKELTLANPGSMSLNNGVVIENTFKAIKLSNGTRYTFDGKGLVVRSLGISVKGVDSAKYPDSPISKNDIEVIVNAPGYTATSTLKQQIIDLINGSNAKFTWTDSPAVQRAVNAALATISDTTVQGYINAATTKARSDNRLASNADTGYQHSDTSVWLVPYLEVNVTNYQPNPYNPSLTATLTIKWRVEVHPGSTTDPIVKEAANVANDKGVYIAKQGVALSLGDDLGEGVAITLDSGIKNATYAHQADTYDYKIGSNAFTVTHAVNGNLGKIVLDTKEPLIMVGEQNKSDPTKVDTTDADLKYFSTLQAAVDAAEDGQLVEISSSYSGSTSINMTGKVRTIYVQANGKNVVVANASGSMVDVNPSGTFYTIKLNRDNSVVASTASITVKTGTNGSAKASAASAKPGDTVTITTTANSGYKAAAPTVVASTGNVTVTGSGNTWTFTVPANATSVTVTPNFVADDGRIFSDVDPKAWYADAVHNCYNTKPRGVSLMQGNTNGTFTPLNQLTRAEMVQILYNLAGQPSVSGTCPFPDVVGTGYHWAAPAITWAASKGYVIGYTDGKFHPEVNVSRQDMILILYRYSGANSSLATGNLNNYYDGTGVGWWANEAMRWATAMGILSGTDSVALNGYLRAPQKAARCEAAVTLWNYYQRYGA